MRDPIDLHKYPVSVTPVSVQPLTRLKQRLDLMERETRHLMTAIMDMKNGIRQLETHPNDTRKLLASGLMASRGWTLSVVMSHCYIQTMLGRNAGSSGQGLLHTAASGQVQLWTRAADQGINEGNRDRG